MSLRTYPFVTHPDFLQFIETDRDDAPEQKGVGLRFPKIDRYTDIADYLGVSPEIIRGLVTFPKVHYRSFDVKKRNGTIRTIDAPRTFLKVVQWWLLDTVLSQRELPRCVFGFVKGRSFIDNARMHYGAKHVLNVDIKNFFPSIGLGAIEKVFCSFGYDPEVAENLAKITSFRGTLPQGAPSSPTIANIVFGDCDGKLENISRKFELKYTRYADDLTFSGKNRIPGPFVTLICEIIEESGFQLNVEKTRFMGPNQRKEITGLILGRDGVVLSREYLNGIRGWFNAVCENPHTYATQRARIRGTKELLRQVGGRGTQKLISCGERALAAIDSVS